MAKSKNLCLRKDLILFFSDFNKSYYLDSIIFINLKNKNTIFQGKKYYKNRSNESILVGCFRFYKGCVQNTKVFLLRPNYMLAYNNATKATRTSADTKGRTKNIKPIKIQNLLKHKRT